MAHVGSFAPIGDVSRVEVDGCDGAVNGLAGSGAKTVDNGRSPGPVWASANFPADRYLLS